MFGWFRKKPCGGRPIKFYPANEPWRVGDLAVCIKDDWLVPCIFHPKVGDILRVAGITTGTANGAPHIKGVALGFEEKPQSMWWYANSFRKPIENDEEISEETKRLLDDALKAGEPCST